MNSEERPVYALQKLEEMGPEALSPLIRALKVKWSWTRYEVARLLGKVGVPALPALKRSLSHQNPDVREGAAVALGEMAEQAAPLVPWLIKALDDREDSVRYAVVEALGRIGADAQTALPRLRQLLKHEVNAISRCNAADAISGISIGIGAPDQDTLKALEEARNDRDDHVVEAAELALESIASLV